MPYIRPLLSIVVLLITMTACNNGQTDETAANQEPQPKVVHIGYQGMLNPWKVGIQSGAFEKATGWKIEWRKFNSGSEVITGMASGDIQIAVAGSSPIATAMSRGVDVELFWILEAIRDNEALVVRDDSGIDKLSQLKGKTIGVPFASTTHYHLLIAMDHHGLTDKDIKLLNLQPDAIMAAWNQKRIDAAFVWSPALNEITKTGKVLLTSGELADMGKPTFDGIMVLKDFAAENSKAMTELVKAIAALDADYRQNKEAWTADSDQVKAIATITGADPAAVPAILAQYHFPDLKEQASATWLGAGAAKALKDTASFLKAQQKINVVHDDYGPFVTDRFAKAALQP